jgi:hypothetical protein
MMPTMTKTSRQVLCLRLLLATQAFLVYCSSPTAPRANIEKSRVAIISFHRKLIRSALVDLHPNKTTTNDKWLALEAIHKLIYSRFDFNDGIDYTICDSKKAVNGLGRGVRSRISQGNHTRIHHLRETKACLKIFILFSSSKDSQLEEPPKGKACWTHTLELSEAIVDSISQTVQIKIFLERFASPETLSQTNHSIAQLCHSSLIVSDHNFSSSGSTGSTQSSSNSIAIRHNLLEQSSSYEACQQSTTRILTPTPPMTGWVGKPKGLLQVLWETRWIDPTLPTTKYHSLLSCVDLLVFLWREM